MHCTGCWAAEYGHKQSLSFEEMGRVLTEAKKLGAHSTDLEAPESAEHLCEKCMAYAECWKPKAEKLWAEEHS